MKILNPYNYDTREHSVATGLNTSGAPKTVQSFKDECDINTIVKRFGITGTLPLNMRTPLPADTVYPLSDYRTLLDTVLAAQKTFGDLPAEVRKRFANDPQEMINFLDNPNNLEESYKLGLRNKPAAPSGPLGAPAGQPESPKS